jgi:hypothetical protein
VHLPLCLLLRLLLRLPLRCQSHPKRCVVIVYGYLTYLLRVWKPKE